MPDHEIVKLSYKYRGFGTGGVDQDTNFQLRGQLKREEVLKMVAHFVTTIWGDEVQFRVLETKQKESDGSCPSDTMAYGFDCSPTSSESED
jgi:hypothetical protein